jgi:signal transduction histidine kinase
VIKCYGELLRGSVADPEQLEDVRVILKHAGQAQNVLQELLNFARPKQTAPVSRDLAAMVGDAVKVFQVQAEKRGVQVEVDSAPDLPRFVANPQHLEQILANLFSNALDAVAPETGRIHVGVGRGRGEDGVVLRVADNGPGISEEHLRRLFDPFFTTKEMGKGTGLGLAVVYGLVAEMGGRIEVENRDGAVFTIHLPGEAPQPHSPPSQGAS